MSLSEAYCEVVGGLKNLNDVSEADRTDIAMTLLHRDLVRMFNRLSLRALSLEPDFTVDLTTQDLTAVATDLSGLYTGALKTGPETRLPAVIGWAKLDTNFPALATR